MSVENFMTIHQKSCQEISPRTTNVNLMVALKKDSRDQSNNKYIFCFFLVEVEIFHRVNTNFDLLDTPE